MRKSPTFKRKVNIKEDTLEWKVLQFLNEVGYIILDASFPKPYASSVLWRQLFELDSKKWKNQGQKWNKSFLNSIIRLQNKNLIAKNIVNKKIRWRLSVRGETALEYSKNLLPAEDGKLRIFVFDIPERKRYYRDWIRTQLVASSYKMLQKSVWLGKRPLPYEFLKDIQEKDLWQDIHLFEVKEEGTLGDLKLD